MSTVLEYVDRHLSRLAELTRDLVRIPSENKPPNGSERPCQEYIAGVLRAAEWEPDSYNITEVHGLSEHAIFHPGRDYSARPNIGARRAGAGRSRSLLLTGHIDRSWRHAALDVGSVRRRGRGQPHLRPRFE